MPPGFHVIHPSVASAIMSDSSRTYPRGKPFKPPEAAETIRPGEAMAPLPVPPPPPAETVQSVTEEVHRQQALLRRWIQILILSTAAALAIIVGTAFYVLQQVRTQAPVARAETPAVPAEKNDRPAPPKEEKRPPLPEKKDDGQVIPKVAIDPEKNDPKVETARDRFMSALGNLTGIHLYQAYLNIGLLADCTEGEVYTTDEAQKWLDRTVAQLELVDKQLDALAKADLDAEERQGIDRCRQASSLLRTQAMELREYWKNSDKDHAMRYHKARDSAWNSISEVLQIPKDQ